MTTHKPTISLDVPRLLLQYAAEKGIDTYGVCEQASLDSVEMQDAYGRIPFEQFAALWEVVTQRSPDPYFGLHFGETVPGFAGGHLLFAILMNCATLGDALERFCRYHNLLADGTRPRLVDETDRFVFTWDQEASTAPQYAEAILSMLSMLLQRLTNDQARPVEVRFVHQQPVELTEYERIFGIQPCFDQYSNGLVLEQQARVMPIFLANPALLMTLEHYAQQVMSRLIPADSWESRVAATVSQLLLHGEKPSLREVARALAISPRHLQNKLQMEGVFYQHVLDGVRKQITMECLKRGDMTVCVVAFWVGFSEQSAFTHAFRRWTGMTPGEYAAIAASKSDS